MTNTPLMPMATAVWLVENTTLTFKQIANFCNMHEVEIQGIADGEVAITLIATGFSPFSQSSVEEQRAPRAVAPPQAAPPAEPPLLLGIHAVQGAEGRDLLGPSDRTAVADQVHDR